MAQFWNFLVGGILAASIMAPVSGADFYWDPDQTQLNNDGDGTSLGGGGTWDLASLNWWDLSNLIAWPNTTPNNADSAIFSYGYDTGLPAFNTVTVSSGIRANQLRFNRSGYTLAGGNLTIEGATPTLFAQMGESATIGSDLLGSAGLFKAGGGSIRLTGNNAGLSGALTIAGGSLVVNSVSALPGSGTISVTSGNDTPSSTSLLGFTGGTLVLDGTAGGLDLSRDLNLEGRGAAGDRSSSVISLGDNTLSGTITTAFSFAVPSTFRNSRINSINGTLTLSGTLVSQGTSASTFVTLGGSNAAGIGNYGFTGILAGTGSVEKSGGGTLFWNPSSVSGFSGTLRISGSASNQQSSVRITESTVGGTSVFGTNTVAGDDPSAVDLNGGVLEFRNDGSLDFGSLASGKNVYLRADSTLFNGPAVGGSGINGTATLGTIRVAANTTATFNSRNGFGFTLGAWTQESSNSNNTVTNNMGGTLRFTGDAWNNSDSGNRTLTMAGGGNTVIGGNINTSGTGLKTLTKNDTGTLTINGTGSTLNGPVNITNGEVAIRDFRSLNNNSAMIALGSSSSTVALIVGTDQAALAAGLITSKVINLSGTTGGANIYANQGLAAPVVLNANFVATGVGAKTLTLGGTSAQDNAINGVITNAGQSFTPSAAVTSGGTVIPFADTTGMIVGQFVSGTGIVTGTTITAVTPTSITLSIATNADRAATDTVSAATAGGSAVSLSKVGSGTWVLAGTNTYTGTTTITNGILKLKANGAISTVLPSTNAVAFNQVNQFGGSTLEFVGQNDVDSVQSLGALTYGAGANTVKVTPGLNGTASLVFSNLSTTGASTLNFVGGDFANNKITLTQVNGAVGNDGIITRSVFWNGADYAYRQGGVLRAPVYGVDSTTATTATGPFSTGTNQQVTGNVATDSVSVATLKIPGSYIVTINSGKTLTVSGAGVLVDDGNAAITGGTLATGSSVLVIRTNQSTDRLDLQSSLTGTGGLTKAGLGTLVISGPNARTGNTNIDEGTVQLSGGGALSGANVTTTIRQGAVLDLNGVSTGTSIGQFNNIGTVTNSSTLPATLTIGNNAGTGTSFGVIEDGTGVIHVTKVSTGAQSWLGASTYTGVTTIGSTGLVTVDVLSNGGSASGIGASTSDAANLVFNGTTGGLVYQGNIMNGNLTLGSQSASTDRLFTLAGTDAGSGATLSSTASNNNAVIWSNPGAIAFGAGAAAQTLIFTGTSVGDNTFNPQITDNGANVTSVTKTAAGQWNFGNGNNSYTGITTISEGILGMNDSNALPYSSPLVLGSSATSGILQMSGLLSRDLAASAIPGSNTVTWGGSTGGGGFAAHTTQLMVLLSGGAPLTWGSGGFVPSGAPLLFGSASALADVVFINPIDLGAAQRTVSVTDNSNTGADFATLAGVISGAGGGIVKTGSNSVLRLTGANTYTGVTDINVGTLVVSSLGNSSDPFNTPTSVGRSGVSFDNSNAITIGNGSTSNAILQYVGPGEVSNRKIRINASTGSSAGAQIHADGSGPLILTNVSNDMVLNTGSKSLWLRGSNTAGNMITSQLSDNGGPLNVNIDGGATWILTNPNNNYSGSTNATGGALGIGADAALGISTLVASNGNVFAYGGDRTISNPLTLSNNASNGWLGDYSLVFNGANNLAVGANSVTTNNSISAGKSLTFNGLTANALTANRSWTIDGPGETVIQGDFTTTTNFGVAITKTGNGILTLGTNGTPASNKPWNQANAGIDVDRGTLRFTTNNAMSSASGAGGVTLSPEVATNDTATVDLNGTAQTINALTATTDGTAVIDNTASTAASLTFGANDSAVNFGGGTGTYTITDSGAGALSIYKAGTAAVTIPSGVTLTHQGATGVTGGTFTIASPVDGTTALSVANSGSTLILSGGLTNPSAIASLVVENGGTLSLLDGAGNKVDSLTNLQLGSLGGTMATLKLNVGDGVSAGDGLNTDQIRLLSGGTLSLFSGNKVSLNLTDIGLSEHQTYDLLTLGAGWSGSGFTSGVLSSTDWVLGATPGGFDSIALFADDNRVYVSTGSLISAPSYWRGSAGGGSDNTWNAFATNWSADKGNTSTASTIPGQGTDVIFAIDSASGSVATTLEQNFRIKSLTFESGASTPSSVSIDPGTTDPNARIEIGGGGIQITSGGPQTAAISGRVKLGADQTWNVADAGSVLSLGVLLGEANVAVTGSGKVVLTSAADPTFNSGHTGGFNIAGATLEIQDAAALGNTVNSNLANIHIGIGGAFYYNNATAGTVSNPLALAGGTLSGGGQNHTYSGAADVSADSFINLRNANGGSGELQERNITLSGVVSGSGSLTVSSDVTLSSGNAMSGTLTLNNAANTWAGDLNFNQGTVTVSATASPGFTANNVRMNSFGRFNLQGVNGQSLTRTGTLTYAGGAIGELGVDNTSSTVTSDFVVDQHGAVSLGSGGTGGNVRVYLSDAFSKLNISGDVALGGNSSISVGGDAAGVVTISGVISDGSSGYALAVNDDAGAWNTTNRTLRLTGLNTFSGNVTIDSGLLEFDTVSDAGGAASSLGQGNAILMGPGGSTLSFTGGTSQSTNRPITTNASVTLSANGTAGATITYAGAISQGTDQSLTLTGTGAGVISGGITQPAGAASADLSVNSGTWTIQNGAVSLADDFYVNGGTVTLQNQTFSLNDDIVVTGASSILNLNSSGLWAPTNPAGTSSGLYARGGAVIYLGANDVNGANNANAADFISLADGTTMGIGTLDTQGYNITIPQLNVGAVADGYTGAALGSGTVTVTSTVTDWGSGIRLYRGTVGASLAGVASILKQGLGDVTLSGDNSGLAATVAATRLDAGNLILDFTSNNNAKISTSAALDMRGGTLTLNGNHSASTIQSVSGFTMGSGGANAVYLNGGSGQSVVLSLGAISRSNGSQDGTVRFFLPTGTQTATNGITTTSPNSIFGLLGTGGSAATNAAYATVDDGSGVICFATGVSNGTNNNVMPLISTAKDDVSSWLPGDHVTDSSGFTGGSLTCTSINSLRFDALAGSDLTVAAGSLFNIASGGILVTSNVGGTPSISGGALVSGTQEFVVHQNSTQSFEIDSAIRGAYGVTKAGPGTLLLSGSNSYADETEIQEGTLQVNGGNAIGDSSLVTLADDHVSTLELLADETIGRLQGGSASTGLNSLATVDLGSHTLTVNQSSSTTYAGYLTGTGSFVLNATGNYNLNLSNISSGFTGQVVVNGGLFQLSGIGQNSASSLTINGSAALLLDKNGTTTSGTQILDTTPIVLNSAISATTVAGGLWIRRDQGSTQNEAVGVVTAASGASYVRAETSAANAITVLTAQNVVRQNSATLVIRGNSMSATSGRRAQFRIDAANEAAFISTMAGGGGAAGSATLSIVPWAIAEDPGTGLIGAGNMGNSLVTYAATSGFRPLDFTTEYANYATAGATNNTRESLSADLTGLSGRALNSLSINSQAVANLAVSGSGSGQKLTNTSGAFLFTLTGGVDSSSYGTAVGGFDDGIETLSGEYLFHVVNPSFASTTATLTASISSPLASEADITKSGRGSLILTGTNTAGGGTKKTTINEGILEISSLANIGGTGGALVFAGGTLRLGAGLTDDLSLRTISFLQGGGTIDTNGVDIALSGSLGSGIGGFTKAGAGNLILNAGATYTGPTTLSGGTLTVGANNATGNGGDLILADSTTLDLGGHSLLAGLVSTTGTTPTISGTGTITAAIGFTFNHTGDTQVGAVLAGAGGLVKLQSNTLTLNGLNTYAGSTEVQAGTLSFDSIGNVGGGASALGAPTTLENGIIRVGYTTAATTLTYTGPGHSTNRIIDMQGTTGGLTINSAGTGALALSTIRGGNGGAKTLTLDGSATGFENSAALITECAATLSVLKSGASTWVLSGTNSYTGTTTVNEGTLRLSTGQTISGALQFGSTSSIATAGTLDVQEDSSFGSLTVQTDSSTNVNQLVIDLGKTLTINGNVVIGSSRGALSNTLFTASGGGALVVNNPAINGTFRVGGYTGGTSGQGNLATADLRSLSSLTVNLDPTSGIVRVNNTSGYNTPGVFAVLQLPQDTSINALTLAVGDGGQFNGTAGQVNQLQLGTGATSLHVNNLNIGTGARDLGSITFQDPSGTLVVRAADGIGAAVFNMGTGSATTGVGLGGNQNTFDVTGHDVDLKFSTVSIGMQNRNQDLVNVFRFDTGTLEIGSLTASSKGSNGYTTTTNVNIGGGTVSTGAWTLASTSGNGTAVATANLTGGTITFSGNINRGTDAVGGGTATGTVNLNGATLDMGGNIIGSATEEIVFNAQSGTLKNLGQLNGGGDLTKTTGATLSLAGTNTYTGKTKVNAGTLRVDGTTDASSEFTVGMGTPDPDAVLGGTGTIGGNVIADGGMLTAGMAGQLLAGTGSNVLTINGNVSAPNTTSTWLVDLTRVAGGDSTGTSVDLLRINGTLDLTNLVLVIDDTNAGLDAFGDRYKFASFTAGIGGWNGTSFFTGLDQGALVYGSVNNSPFTIDYDFDNGAFYLISAVPEPEVWLPAALMLLLGIGKSILRRRRRRA